MTGFTHFSNILPDPLNPIGTAGETLTPGAATQDSHVGISSLKVTSKSESLSSRTNSGRLVSSMSGKHSWQFDLSYNPMTREEFEPVYNFLLQKKGRYSPFYFTLPTHLTTRNTTFWNNLNSGTTTMVIENEEVSSSVLRVGREYFISTQGNTNWLNVMDPANGSSNLNHVFRATNTASGSGYARELYMVPGQDSFLLTSNNSYSAAVHGTPLPGDFFTIEDSYDSNHTKLYRVTRVETVSNYQGNNPPPSNSETTNNEAIRVHFMPPLRRYVRYSTAQVNFKDPRPRVMLTTDVQDYSLDVDNLYSFSLKLEEAEK